MAVGMVADTAERTASMVDIKATEHNSAFAIVFVPTLAGKNSGLALFYATLSGDRLLGRVKVQKIAAFIFRVWAFS